MWLRREGFEMIGVGLAGGYPATLLVVTFRHFGFPGSTFTWHWPAWKGRCEVPAQAGSWGAP